MFTRSIIAISLSAMTASAVYAQNNTQAPLETLPASKSIPIESYGLSAQNTSSAVVEHAASMPEEQTTADVPASAPQAATKKEAEEVAASQPASTPNATTSTEPARPSYAVANDWSLTALNEAQWSSDLARGQFPVYAKAQVLLNRKFASPGAIDGMTGMNTLKAISSYQTMNGLTVDGVLNEETWNSLNAGQHDPVFIEYTLTEADLKSSYAKSIPATPAERAKMKGMYYTRVTEMLGEKFHMDENFLKKLNPKATFNKAGEKLIVANVSNKLPEDIHLIIAHKSAKQLYLFNSKNKMIAAFPATVGKEGTPSPTGTLTISNIAPNPWYSYNPKNFGRDKGEVYSIPPGPNNYVGNMWIGLSRPSFGIHGTPEPSNISKGTGSNGCVRLTNWDATNLSKYVKPGVSVKFIE